MKKSFVKRLLAALIVVATLVPATTFSAYAESTVGDWFDFEKLQMQIEPGGSFTQRFTSINPYRVFQTGNTSKKTYVAISGKSGSQDITFHVGADETASRVMFWFYVWGAPDEADIHQGIIVDVVQPNPAKPDTKTALAASDTAAVAFSNGTTGSLTTAFDNNVGLLSDAKGTPRAAFAIVSKENQLCKLQVYESVALNGYCFPAVRTVGYDKEVTISISEADKAAAIADGVFGLYLNGKFVLWP